MTPEQEAALTDAYEVAGKLFDAIVRVSNNLDDSPLIESWENDTARIRYEIKALRRSLEQRATRT